MSFGAQAIREQVKKTNKYWLLLSTRAWQYFGPLYKYRDLIQRYHLQKRHATIHEDLFLNCLRKFYGWFGVHIKYFALLYNWYETFHNAADESRSLSFTKYNFRFLTLFDEGDCSRFTTNLVCETKKTNIRKTKEWGSKMKI